MRKNLSTSSFKNFALIAVSFLLPIVGALYFFDYIFTKALLASNHEDISYLNKVVSGGVNADVLVTGSSRALVHFDCDTISTETGATCFNMGLNGTGLQMQLPVLEAYLSSNEKPELIVQEVGVTTLNRPSEEKLIYNPSQYMPFLDNSEIYKQLENLNSSIWKSKYIPFYDYILYRDNMFDAIKALSGSSLTNRRSENGFRPTNRKWDGSFDRLKENHPSGIEIDIDEEFVSYLRQIIELAKAHNSKIILVYTPEYSENQEFIQNRDSIVSNYKELAKEYAVEFIDYSSSDMTKRRSNYYNSQHLNADAASEFSRIFSNDINIFINH